MALMEGVPVESVLMFDVGGTNFRHAVVEEGKIVQLNKTISPSFSNFPEKSPRELVSEFHK